jgi:hypothetical protein
MPTDESPFLHKLEVEVEAELELAESSESQAPGASPAEWLFDPADVEREEVGLRNLLGAVEALELDSPPVHGEDID